MVANVACRVPHKQSQRGVVFVVREKETILHEVVKGVTKEDLAKKKMGNLLMQITSYFPLLVTLLL